MEKIKLYYEPLDVENPFGREKELKEIEENISHHNNLILLGPRRVGKTTLLNAIKRRNEGKYKIIKYDCEKHRKVNSFFAELYVSVKKLKFFVSSVMKKDKENLKEERKWTEKIIKEQGHEAFLIENIVSNHSGKDVEEENIKDSDGFIIILGEDEDGVSDEVVKEYGFATKYEIPVFCFVKGLNDEKRDNRAINIIEDIKENQRGIYKRYENLEEFKKVLRDAVVKKEEEIREKAKDRYKNYDFRKVGDLFFNAISKERDEEFLILIDEFGELRHDKDLNIDEFLAYFKAKIIEEKPENCTFVLTGSENIFTTTYSKYFGGFKYIKIEKFDIKTAKELIINQLEWDKQNKFLDKIIEISGTLPKDLVYVISELKKNKQTPDNNEVKNILKNIINENPEIELHNQYPALNKEEVNFINNISEILPASKREILSRYNKEEIFEKIYKEYFILDRRDDGKYEFVSKLMWWKIIYEKYEKNFDKLLDNILKNGSTINK